MKTEKGQCDEMRIYKRITANILLNSTKQSKEARNKRIKRGVKEMENKKEKNIVR